MCLIVQTKQDIPMTQNFIANVINRNKDGFGMMWITDEELKHHKSATNTLEEVWEKYEEVKEFNPYVHFRMKTHGNIDQHNAHPYDCGHGIFLMHNGVLRTGNIKDQNYSDTWHFVNDIVKPLLNEVRDPHKFIHTISFMAILEEFAGYNNKLVVGSKYGFVITRLDQWVQIKNPWTKMEGIFVSNQYAWNENEFRDPTIAELTRKQQKRLARQMKRHGHHGTNVIGFGGGSGTGLVEMTGTITKTRQFGRPEDYFRSNKYGLEEYDDDYMLDTQNNVWKITPHGYRRCFDISFEDLVNMTREKRQKNETILAMQEAARQATLAFQDKNGVQLPALVCKPPTNHVPITIDAEEEELINRAAETGYDEEAYTDAVVKKWQQYTSDEIAENILVAPDEAHIILERSLGVGHAI